MVENYKENFETVYNGVNKRKQIINTVNMLLTFRIIDLK